MANRLTGLKGGGVIGQERTVTSATQNHPLGAVAVDELGNEYVYLKGVASTAQYDWVTYDETYATTRLTKAEADKLKPMAIAQSANVANQYGWYLVYGEGSANVLASCAKEVAIYTSATAGSADDAATSQTKINRAICRATDAGSGGAVLVSVQYPSAN
jgi:hypothetical protein